MTQDNGGAHRGRSDTFTEDVSSYTEPWLEMFVPGRIALFGEHTDWSGQFRRFNSAISVGATMVVGTNQGLYARCRKQRTSMLLIHSVLPQNFDTANMNKSVKSDGYSVVTSSHDGKATMTVPMDIAVLKRIASEGSFFSYVAGTAAKIIQDYKVSGIEIDILKCDLPIAKGLSSSAAVCVLVARSFNRVFDLKGTIRFEMEYAYAGENLTPSRCGRMDQACAFGRRPVLMNYDADNIDVVELSVGRPLHYLIVDLGYPGKSTTEILQALQSAYPFPQNEVERGAHHLFGEFNLKTVDVAIAALKAGDAEQLGKLMTDAQVEFNRLAKPLCPSQLTMPILNSLLAHPRMQCHIFGGKGVGSQGDGTAQLLCKSKKDCEAVSQIIAEDFPDMTTLPLVLEKNTGKVRKAVILAA